MEYLTDGELNAIIKKHWPKTTPTVGLYNMMRDAADLRVKKLLAEEAKQEPVASYRLSSPIAEPDTATQAPSERLDTPDFQSLMLDFRAAPEYDAALYNKIMAAIYSWHQRTTQAVKPLTDEQIMRLAGDMKQRNAGVWPGDVAFARAIETHLKGD